MGIGEWSRPLRICTLYCNSIVYLYYHAGAGPTKLVPRTRLLKICRNAVVRDTFISLRVLRCITFLSPKRYNPAVLIYLRLYLYISGCTYVYISRCTYISPAVFIYLRLYLYISGCIYISQAVFIYLGFYTILTQTSPQKFDTNGAPLLSLVVFIYLWLYLYISGCTYISPAVLIYLRLYLYISRFTQF